MPHAASGRLQPIDEAIETAGYDQSFNAARGKWSVATSRPASGNSWCMLFQCRTRQVVGCNNPMK